MSKNRFLQHVQKTEHHEGDLEFFMQLKRNSFRKLIFFTRINKKLQKTNIFLLKITKMV